MEEIKPRRTLSVDGKVPPCQYCGHNRWKTLSKEKEEYKCRKCGAKRQVNYVLNEETKQ